MFTGNSDREPALEETISNDVLVRDAIGKLDRQDREIVMLREFEQLSYAEIAVLLKLPVNTVRSRLFRARAALHELLTAPASGVTEKNFAKTELKEGV
jgi:RNA polymerase sigma-70 factor (ECF subfamily)